MGRRSIAIIAAACLMVPAVALTQTAPVKPTTVVRFVVSREELPHVSPSNGTCGPSAAAWFRSDARRCTTGMSVYDPCFVTPSVTFQPTVTHLCNVDPRNQGQAVLVDDLSVRPAAPPARGIHVAWFLELADGTTCRPLAEAGREVDGIAELYSCRFGSDGNYDAVLGDLNTSQPVWTISKVLMNKKTEPPTIKSSVMAPVTRVWK